MNDDINTLDFALVVDQPFDRIFRKEQTEQLKEASPPPGAQGVWNNHSGGEL